MASDVTFGKRRATARRPLPRWLGSAAAFLPFAALMVVGLIAPTIVFLQYAFEDGLQGFVDFAGSPAKVDGVVRTVVISLQTTAICVVLGYVYVGAMLRAKPWLRATLLVIVVLPFLTSILVRTYGWIVVLGNEGPINDLLRAIGGEGAATQLLYNRVGVLVGMTHIMLPFFVLPLLSVWSQVPENLAKAARTLGASRVEAFLRVELPLTLSGAAAGALLVFVASLGFFITPALLGGQGDTMVSQLIDRELMRSADLADAAVLATVLLASVVVLLAAFRLFYPLELLFVQGGAATSRRRGVRLPRGGAGRHARLLTPRLRTTRMLSRLPWRSLLFASAGLIAGFLLLPLAIVVPVSLTGESYLHFPPDSLSLRWFEAVVSDESWRRAALNSLATGAMATAIVFVVGMPVAFALARSRMRSGAKGAVILVAMLPALVPLIVLALGLYVWFLEARLLDNLAALAVAHAMLGLPFLIIIVMAALRDFDIRLERAARSLGAGPLTTLRLVTLPLVRGAILAGLLFAFLQSFDELLIARAVTGVDTTTLPVKMWNGANEEISPALGAVSVLSLALTLIAGAALLGARRARRTEITDDGI